MKKHAGQFTSKVDGLKRRKSIWHCQRCLLQYKQNPKKNVCICGSKNFVYFPSAIEAKRFIDLRLAQDAGTIHELKTHYAFPIELHGKKITTYYADFIYRKTNGDFVVEDVKPKMFRTDLYKLKKKLVEAVYSIKISEITK